MLTKTKDFFSKSIQFLKDVANDERIPPRDKKVLLGMITLIISPLDIIPDWIPVIGVLDDLVLIALVLDYFFEILDDDILLSHYPWDMKSFARLRSMSRWISHMTPNVVREHIWKFEPSPYRK